MSETTEPHREEQPRGSRRWRTVDIIVTSTIAVAFGVVFWAWNTIWKGGEGLFAFFPPAQAVMYGVWLIPATLGALVVRRIGAAFYTETVAAAVSVLLGSPWGVTAIVQGAVEGLGAEAGFAVLGYRTYRVPAALLAGGLGGLFATAFDAFYWYPTMAWLSFRLPYIAIGTASSLLIAGLGAAALTRALAQTGVLDRFPSGRERTAV